MSKSKKSGRIPQPIRVKKEKTEEDRAIHSMAYYVDDRLELVKQIFGSLKKKTITNLAPEYLKEKEMEEIQELCLHELLCFSKKRLLSVINATKCPTDTESSDDSDVEAKDEHVSLEEISSESEMENGNKAAKKGGSHSRIKSNTEKIKQSDVKTDTGGEISVLELLELQARARAIRSQLAFEPVTKIEVDSETDTEWNSKSSTVTGTAKRTSSKEREISQKPKKSHTKLSNLEKASSSSKENTTNDILIKSKELIQTTNENVKKRISKQKIKIKRNFRKQKKEDEIEETNIEILDKIEKSTTTKSASTELKKEKHSHSPSPDVVPIEAEPETFCISDSSCEDEDVITTKDSAKSSVSMPHNGEIEDGEIVELSDNTSKANAILEQVKDSAERKENSNAASKSVSEMQKETVANLPDDSSKHSNDSVNEINDDGIGTSETANMQSEDKSKFLQSSTLHDHDDEHNDDVISIEGGDLENEMSEH